MSTKNYTTGSSAGTVAAGDDSRFAQIAQNTSDIANLATTVSGNTSAISGKAAKGANADITSLTGLTTALSVAQGGTGSTTQNFVDLSSAQTIAGNKTLSGATAITGTLTVPAPSATGHAATKSYVDSAIAAGAADASTTAKGIIQLAGDLAGTATSPVIASGAVTTAKLADASVTSAKIVDGTIVAADISSTAAIAAGQLDSTTQTILASVANKAAKGANSDITSLTGLTTALSLAQGGTGGTSASTARTSLGLGGAALLNVGTASGTVAAGDDSRLAASTTNTAAIIKLTLTPTGSKTAAYTAAAQDLVMCSATGGAFTVTLPTAPADGTLVAVKKTDATANAVTIATGGSDTFSIGTTTAQLILQGQAATVRYMTTGAMWVGVSDSMPLSAVDARYVQQTVAAATYAPIANPTFTGTVNGITKAMVGLANVDNVSDVNKPVSTAQAAADTLSQSTLAGTNTQTAAAYQLVLSDAGKVIEMNNASANTVTVPTNATVALPIATIIEICQIGTGQTTIAAAAGVTLRSPNGLRSAAQYASISLRKRATDEWVVSGYTAP